MRFIKTIKSYIRCPRKLIRIFGRRGFFNWMPDDLYLKLVYWGETGKKLNLDSPLTYNEKLQWLKLNDRKPEYSIYADKYMVRSYISKTIGEQYLIPLLEVYNSVDEINWCNLPDRFVLKCTHGSGCNIICRDKSNLDIMNTKKMLNSWLNKNWFWFGREWPYKEIKPRIVCEAFISENDNTPDDYKVMCFNGKAKLIQVHIDRYGDLREDNYDENWNKTKISRHNNNSNFLYEEPSQFDTMKQLSEQIAADMRHVRIDWFIIKDKLFFGEITFYDGSGFLPFDNEQDDYLLGSWINLIN